MTCIDASHSQESCPKKTGPVSDLAQLNCPVQSQKKVRSLKFGIKEEVELYYFVVKIKTLINCQILHS